MEERDYMRKPPVGEAPQETQTKTQTQTPDTVAKASAFERLPRAAGMSLARADMTFPEWGVYCYVVAAMDYRTGELAIGLGGLADAIQWEWTEDYLRKCLRATAGKGWLTVETRRGPRATWTIRLGPRHEAALHQGVVPEVVFNGGFQSNSRLISDSDPPFQSEIDSDGLALPSPAIPDE